MSNYKLEAEFGPKKAFPLELLHMLREEWFFVKVGHELLLQIEYCSFYAHQHVKVFRASFFPSKDYYHT